MIDGQSTQSGSNVPTATPTAPGEINVQENEKDQFNIGESTQSRSNVPTAMPTAPGDSPVVINVQENEKDQFNIGESTQSGSNVPTVTAPVVINVQEATAPVVINVQEAVVINVQETVPEVSQGVEHWDRKISEVKVDYNNHGDYIYKTFTISVGFLAVIVTAMFYCARQIKETVGCDGWWNRLIHSAQILLTMVSSTTIAIVVFEFVQQFKLLELEQQYQQKRDLEPNNCAQDGSRQLLSNYRSGFYWWLLRCAFILIFFVFSAYIFATWTHLRCP